MTFEEKFEKFISEIKDNKVKDSKITEIFTTDEEIEQAYNSLYEMGIDIILPESNTILPKSQLWSYSIFFIGIDVLPMVAYNIPVIAMKKIIIIIKKHRLCFIFSHAVQSSWVSYNEDDIGNIIKIYTNVIIKIMNQNNFIFMPPPNVLLLLTSKGTIKTWHQANVNPNNTITLRTQPIIDSLSSGWEKYINI